MNDSSDDSIVFDPLAELCKRKREDFFKNLKEFEEVEEFLAKAEYVRILSERVFTGNIVLKPPNPEYADKFFINAFYMDACLRKTEELEHAADPADGRLETIKDAQPHEFPWLVRIGRNTEDMITNFIGGCLISPTHVITAAQNVAHWIFQDIYVGVGIHNLKAFRREDEGYKIKVAKIIVHQEFVTSASTQTLYDMAVLRLAEPAKIDDQHEISTIDLPKPNTIYDENTGWVAGWGTTSMTRNEPSDSLKKTPIQLWERNARNKHLKTHSLPEDSLIVVRFPMAIDYCADTGSPVMIRNSKGHYELAGLVTFGRICRCVRKNCQAGCYVSTEFLLDWIKEVTKNDTKLWPK